MSEYRSELHIDGQPVYEFRVAFLPAVILAQKITVRGNAVIFQNTGTSTVILDSVWEIPAGGTFQFGDPSSLLGTIVQEFRVKFSKTGQQTDRLQVAVLLMNDPRLAHYIDQNTRR